MAGGGGRVFLADVLVDACVWLLAVAGGSGDSHIRIGCGSAVILIGGKFKIGRGWGVDLSDARLGILRLMAAAGGRVFLADVLVDACVWLLAVAQWQWQWYIRIGCGSAVILIGGKYKIGLVLVDSFGFFCEWQWLNKWQRLNKWQWRGDSSLFGRRVFRRSF
jgi:hypothetical protein